MAIKISGTTIIDDQRTFVNYGSKHNELGTGSGTRNIDLTLGNYVSATVSGPTTFTF